MRLFQTRRRSNRMEWLECVNLRTNETWFELIGYHCLVNRGYRAIATAFSSVLNHDLWYFKYIIMYAHNYNNNYDDFMILINPSIL